MTVDPGFEGFLRDHAAALGRVAFQLTHHQEAAADLVQDVLLRAYRHWDRVDRAETPYGYVRRMLVNAHLNSVRRRQVGTVPIVEAGRIAVPDRYADDVVDRMVVWQALARLPARQRAVLVLRHYEQCDDAEIASVLGCRRATVRSLAARGLAAMRRALNEQRHEIPSDDHQVQQEER